MSETLLNAKLMQLANVASKVNDPHYKTCVKELEAQAASRSTSIFIF